VRAPFIKDKTKLAKMITKIENGEGEKLLEKFSPYSGKSFYIGITGPPGVGKSTIISKIAPFFMKNEKLVGIITIDPTSPFSGGALLGDRIRMNELTTDERIFIRSMATRGNLGGIAEKTEDVALLLEAWGMDYILIETVGVGQVEVEIKDICDTVIVIFAPGLGDSIQAMKAGLLEIAHIIVVNKSDKEGIDEMVRELEFGIKLLSKGENTWIPPILKTTGMKGEGISLLYQKVLEHQKFLKESGKFEKERRRRVKSKIEHSIQRWLKEYIKFKFPEKKMNQFVEEIYENGISLGKIINKVKEELGV
jgi:LAO/AO transport system kinase